jgi:hypothetical protein
VRTAFRRTPSDARKALFLFDRCDGRLGLQFDDPKVKPCAEVLLPAHEPTRARFVGGDRSPDRIPILKVRVLALYCVVHLFGRRAHCRLMHLPELTTHLTEMFTEDNLRIYVDANRDLDKNQKPSMVT